MDKTAQASLPYAASFPPSCIYTSNSNSNNSNNHSARIWYNPLTPRSKRGEEKERGAVKVVQYKYNYI